MGCDAFVEDEEFELFVEDYDTGDVYGKITFKKPKGTRLIIDHNGRDR